jgi:hypothetical protein
MPNVNRSALQQGRGGCRDRSEFKNRTEQNVYTPESGLLIGGRHGRRDNLHAKSLRDSGGEGRKAALR